MGLLDLVFPISGELGCPRVLATLSHRDVQPHNLTSQTSDITAQKSDVSVAVPYRFTCLALILDHGILPRPGTLIVQYVVD